MDLWSMVLGLFGVSWVMPQSVVGLLTCWQGKLWHQNGHIWLLVPRCLMWCLWKERNSRCFEDNERSITNLKLIFFRTLLDWLSALWNQSFSSFLDLLDSCNFCTWFVGLGGPFFDINKTYYLSKKKKNWLYFSFSTPSCAKFAFLFCLIKNFITYQNK